MPWELEKLAGGIQGEGRPWSVVRGPSHLTSEERRPCGYGQRTTDNGLLTTDHGQRTTDNGLLTTAHQAGEPHRKWNEYYIGPLEIFLLKYFFAGIHSL